MLLTVLKIAAISSAAVFAPDAAVARTGDVAFVSYADLNLGSVADQDRLRGRVENAALHVCHYDPQERQMAYRRIMDRCVADTTAEAEGEVTALISGAR